MGGFVKIDIFGPSRLTPGGRTLVVIPGERSEGRGSSPAPPRSTPGLVLDPLPLRAFGAPAGDDSEDGMTAAQATTRFACDPMPVRPRDPARFEPVPFAPIIPAG